LVDTAGKKKKKDPTPVNLVHKFTDGKKAPKRKKRGNKK